jgi:4-amino-4-deoxy-L-arabinose transferase-like glycosyltransferase
MTQTSQKKQNLADEHIENITPPSRLSAFAKTTFQRISTQYWIPCIAIGAIALACNLFELGKQSMWFDEILSVERARQSFPVLWQIIFATQPNMALYYIFLHFWLSLTSLLGLNPTEIVVRFPSAVFAALSSMVIFLLGRRFLGFIAGLVAAALYLFNNLQLVYAQETRSYALQLFLICVAWYALFAALTKPSHQKRWWLCYALVTVLAIYSHLFSLLILLAQVAAFAVLLLLPGEWYTRTRQQLRVFIAVLAGIFVLILPLLYASRYGSKTGWLPIPHPMDIYLLFLTINANSRIYLYLLLAFCLLGLFVAIISYPTWGKRLLSKIQLIDDMGDKRLARFQQWLPVVLALLCWLIIPIVLSYFISQGSTRLFSSRYLVTIVPPFMLLVGLGLAVIRWRVIQIVLVLGLLLLTIHYLPLPYQRTQAEDWNITSSWLEHHYQANDGLVCYDNAQGCQVSIEYYLTAYPSAAHFTADSPGSFLWVNYDLTNQLGNAEPAVDPKFLSTFASNHPRLFFIVGRISSQSKAARAHSAQQWLDSHYRFIDQITSPTVTIRLYATG